ncbi:hypothetical protein BOTBODRAFT_56036 [Botryobasidium botryosum FD-172 SS1]|uniref:F-box domain-containing protein n=1 Tax=Botryobasidium botryosum (strain FD-172 SS1) TaxID=930990 RepID=A0A067MCL7_BOTB1|nr:hypothetical protein BOTBODRAFT_56036 [Botryobasidium botryosum FD-172 SS1]
MHALFEKAGHQIRKSVLMVGLPDEIITSILLELCFTDILLCSSVCKRLHDIIAASSSIQYRIELGRLGYADVPCSDLAASELLARIRKHRIAWENFAWTRSEDFSLQYQPGLIWLTSGVLAMLSAERRKITVLRLPSTSSDNGAQPLSYEFDFAVETVAMDPGADLLVLLERPTLSALPGGFCRIHVRSLSTCEPHPSAAVPVHRVSIGQLPRQHSLELIGDTIALFSRIFRLSPASLIILQWRTGLPRIRMPHSLSSEISSFCFLSPTEFLLTRFLDDPLILDKVGSEGTMFIDIYKIPQEGKIYPSGSNLHPTHVATFMLPPISEHVSIEGFTCTVDLPQSPLSYTAGCRTPDRPFSIPPENRTFSFSLAYEPDNEPLLLKHALFVHASTLLSYQKYRHTTPAPLALFPSSNPANAHVDAGTTVGNSAPANDSGSNTRCIVIPWREWGPSNTRWLEHPYGFHPGCSGSKFGQRVHPPLDCPLTKVGLVRVLDFNPHRSRADQDEDGVCDAKEDKGSEKTEGAESRDTRYTLIGEGDVMAADVTWTTVIPKGSPFKEDVYTSLPYRETIKDVGYRGKSILIDEENIVLPQYSMGTSSPVTRCLHF